MQQPATGLVRASSAPIAQAALDPTGIGHASRRPVVVARYRPEQDTEMPVVRDRQGIETEAHSGGGVVRAGDADHFATMQERHDDVEAVGVDCRMTMPIAG